MTKRLGWIGVLSLICAGVSAGPVIEAQNVSTHRTGSNAGTAHGQQSPARNSATPPKAATTNRGQQAALAAQRRPSSTALLPPAGTVQAHPSGAVPAQSSASPQPQPASSNPPVEPNIHAVQQPAGPTAYGVVPPPSAGTTTGTLMMNQSNQTAAGVPPSGDQSKQPSESDTSDRKPSKDEPTPTQSTNIQNRKPPRQKPMPPPAGPPLPIKGRNLPPEWPQPIPSPLFTLQQGVPLQRGIPTRGDQQPLPAAPYSPHTPSRPPAGIADSVPGRPQGNTSTEDGQPASPPPQHTPQDASKPDQSGPPKSLDGGNFVQVHQPTPDPPFLPPPVLNLTTSSSRPVAGKQVVVTAALNPSHAGTSYQLNWGDGSAVETVSDSATHRYAKAKTYTVSARTTTVDKMQLNHEIVLQVQPVIWPRVTVMLASVAGLGLLSLPMLVNVSTGCRWDVPKVTVVGPQPHVSLSFVPDVGAAEERITFLKTKRRSG